MISLVITNYNSASYQSFVYTDYLSREDIVNERYKLEQCLKVGDK